MARETLISSLRDLLGPENIAADEAALEAYSYDATRLKGRPDVVVRPGSEEDVAKVLLIAARHSVPIVPRGAGTGLSGGAVASGGGIVLSFERMDRLLNIDMPNRTATLQPGLVTGVLQREVEKAGLFYPPDPGSRDYCTMGGNVAENAGGMRAVKYGVTRDYVIALRAVLPTGEIVRTGVKTAKGVVGYDLTRLIVGSEGTLAVVTEITVRLLPFPERVLTMTALFKDAASAGRAVAAVMASRVTPRCLEFMDGEALRAGAKLAGVTLPGDAGSFLLIETDGTESEATRQADEVRALVAEEAISVSKPASGADAASLWKLRRSASQAMFTIAPDKINEDTVVPVDKVPAALDGFGAIARKRGLKVVCFGHAGDGNIHVNVLTDLKEEGKRAAADAAVKDVMELVLSLGGTISGEHGVGLTKKPFIGMELSADELGLMRRIKAAFDPSGILNPGKIFPPAGE